MGNNFTKRMARKKKMAIMKKMVEIQDKMKIMANTRPSQFAEDQGPPVLVTVAWIAIVFVIVFFILWIVGGEGYL